MHPHTRRNVLTVLKIALAVAILVYLVFQARDPIAKLSRQTIEWRFLAAALVCSLVATGLSFVRWHILIRALDMDMRLVDSLRLGALGFALNFVSPGSIGGDFFKAIFLAHGHPGKRTEAVATVVADRVAGLLTMLALACVGILVTGMLHTGPPWLRVLCQSILVATAISWIGFLLIIFLGGRAGTRIRGVAEKIPVAGKTIARLLGAVDVYRSRKRMLLGAFGVSVVMALGFVTTFYLVARGLPIHEPSWSEHLVIVPVAGLVGAIPLTPSGLGTTELAIEKLYSAMPGGVPDDGTLVGLGRRATDLVVAFIGLGFYLSHRREVDEVFAEAEHEADAE
jgi:glycosyltransferase 2 family protein